MCDLIQSGIFVVGIFVVGILDMELWQYCHYGFNRAVLVARVPGPAVIDRTRKHSTVEGRFTAVSLDYFGRSDKFYSFAMTVRKELHFTTTEATPQRNQTIRRAETSSKAPLKIQIHEDTTHGQDKDRSGKFGNQMVAYTKSPDQIQICNIFFFRVYPD